MDNSDTASTTSQQPNPDVVADKVLKRAELRKMARRLQNGLALAQFKTKHGWEDLTLDTIEPKVEEMRRKRLAEGEVFSDSSSSTSDVPYSSKALMSSPLKASLFSDAIGSSNGSTGHRKRTYIAPMEYIASSPSKRLRSSPTPHKYFTAGQTTWKNHHQLAQSSPIKPRRQQHFTTSTGPDVSFFNGSQQIADILTSPTRVAMSDDEDDDSDEPLPIHSFQLHNPRSSPPSTPPRPGRSSLGRRSKEGNAASTGEEGADLLLYLAASPSPAVKTRMEPPSTPPPKFKSVLPSSMMTTPGGGNPFPNTPGLNFDFSDYIHMTPSPAQKPWKTPSARTPVVLPGSKTPLSVARRRLTFEDYP